ncbi:MAG: DUF116 domain-containing protein [Chitinivibrionales bacterium]|nr:DUF116 domain-containing protein [Chitinivibrionales bacterium]
MSFSLPLGAAVQKSELTRYNWRSAWTKLTFLSLCWLSYVIFAALGSVIYYLIFPRLENTGFDIVVLSLFVLFVTVLGVGLALITITSLTGIDLLYPHGKPALTVTVLFPIAEMLSKLFGIKKSKLRTSFVKVNNALTIAQAKRIKSNRVLVLLPHCLQIDVCNRKITNDINNCARCKRCPVAELLELGDKYGLKIDVVNGGTLAVRKVKQFRPDGIVAVACERDLTFGILDVYPIPVYGVLNDRPYGPCYNTCVDMNFVEEAVRFFKNSRKQKAPASS